MTESEMRDYERWAAAAQEQIDGVRNYLKDDGYAATDIQVLEILQDIDPALACEVNNHILQQREAGRLRPSGELESCAEAALADAMAHLITERRVDGEPRPSTGGSRR